MLALERTKSFKKDILKVKFSNQHYVKYILYLGCLLNGDSLPREAFDHSLNGIWQGYRDLHINGDLLLIYKIEGNILYLVRIGSHSQLFD
jgi:mRNA interferase YafQ